MSDNAEDNFVRNSDFEEDYLTKEGECPEYRSIFPDAISLGDGDPDPNVNWEKNANFENDTAKEEECPEPGLTVKNNADEEESERENNEKSECRSSVSPTFLYMVFGVLATLSAFTLLFCGIFVAGPGILVKDFQVSYVSGEKYDFFIPIRHTGTLC